VLLPAQEQRPGRRAQQISRAKPRRQEVAQPVGAFGRRVVRAKQKPHVVLWGVSFFAELLGKISHNVRI
jgi:hypothetical protein